MSTYRYLMQAQDTSLGQTVRWGATDPDFRALQYASTSDIDLSTVRILKKYEPMGGGFAPREAGLTDQEQSAMLGGYLPRTALTSYPVEVDGTHQTDNSQVDIWADLTDHHASLLHQGDPLWDASEHAVQLRRSNGDWFAGEGDGDYWDPLHQETHTLSFRVKLDSSVGSSNFYTILDSSQSGSSTGVWLRVNDAQEAVWDIYDSGTSLGSLTGATSLDDGNWHDVTVGMDSSGPSAELWIDGSSVATTSWSSLPSGSVTDLAVGASIDGSLTHHFDGWVQAWGAYLDKGVQSDLEAWTQGRAFSTAPPVINTTPLVTEWQHLPSSPSHGDRVDIDWSRIGHGRIAVRWDDKRGLWVLVDSWGSRQSVPLTKSGGVNTDLLSISTTNSPSVSVSSELITISHDQASTTQEWIATLPLAFNQGNGVLEADFDLNGSSAPTQDGTTRIFRSSCQMAEADQTTSCEAASILSNGIDPPDLNIDEWDETGSKVGFTTGVSGVSKTEVHTIRSRAATSDLPGSTKTFTAGSVSSDSGSHGGRSGVQNAAPSRLTAILASKTNSNYDTTVSVDFHDLRVRV